MTSLSNVDKIKFWIKSSLNKTETKDIFNHLQDHFRVYEEQTVSEVKEFKRRTTKGKGDLFEDFSVLYFKAKGYEAWKLKDLPDKIREELKLGKQDMGIDIILRDKLGKYSAVQAKYRVRKSGASAPPGGRRISVPWGELATFHALCSRTGPWDKLFVITNADYVKRLGKKDSKDKTIAYKTLSNTPHKIWLEMCGSVGQTLVESTEKKVSKTVKLTSSERADILERLLGRPVKGKQEKKKVKKKIVIIDEDETDKES